MNNMNTAIKKILANKIAISSIYGLFALAASIQSILLGTHTFVEGGIDVVYTNSRTTSN